MKLELLNGLFFIGLVILLSGCTYSEPKDQWYQHPGKYYSLGLAYIGTSFLPDPVQAEKDAEAEAIAGLASSLRSRIEGVDKDWMVMQGKKTRIPQPRKGSSDCSALHERSEKD
jgi:hypothetical protein